MRRTSPTTRRRVSGAGMPSVASPSEASSAGLESSHGGLQAGTEGKHVNRLAQWAAGQGHHFGLNHYPHHGLTGLKSLRRSVKVGGYGEERFWKSRTEAYVDLLRWCIRQRELVKICFDQPPPVLAEIELRARYPGVYGPGGFSTLSTRRPARWATATWCSTNP